MDEYKWWLIMDEDVNKIRTALERAIKEVANNYTRLTYKDALHRLDSGLHITDTIPDDFK